LFDGAVWRSDGGMAFPAQHHCKAVIFEKPLGIFRALCRFSSAFRPSNNPLSDRPPPSGHHAIGRLGLWCWTASDLASVEYHSPLPELGNSADRQADDRQGWPARLVWALRKLEEDCDSARLVADFGRPFLLDANFKRICDGF
jgi:hypothetical protein